MTVQTLQIPPVVPATELAALVASHLEIRLLDVRTPAEYESAHIRGAYNVPLDTLAEHGPEIRAHVAEPLVLVCQSGQRARKAEDALRDAGLPSLHVLEGGMNAWSAAGLPVVRGRRRLSIERQVRVTAGALAGLGGVLALTVSPAFAAVPALVGGGLVFAGLTDTCGMAMLLARLPYNRRTSCDVGTMVRALTQGVPPASTSRDGSSLVSRAAPSGPCCA